MIGINIDGNIKTYNSIPEKWNKIHYYHTLEPEIHYEDGFRPFVTPTLTETQKLGAMIYDAVNDVFTYSKVDKSVEELANEKEQKYQEEKEKIKQAKVDKMVEDALTPTERLNYYPEWKQQAYKAGEKVTYKGKTFENTVEGNINAPDKGGWIEIK